jgi:hypothetical protein
MEFVADGLVERRRVSIFAAIDDHTRECVCLEADYSMPSRTVTTARLTPAEDCICGDTRNDDTPQRDCYGFPGHSISRFQSMTLRSARWRC